MTRIKVLFLTSGLGVGGAERMLQKLIMASRQLEPNEIDFIVVSLRSRELVGIQLESNGISVEYLGLNSGIIRFFQGLSKLISIYRRDIDLVQSWMYHADFLASLFKMLFPRKPLIWGLRNSTLSLKGSSYSSIIIRTALVPLSYLIPSLIVSCSKNAISQHIAIGFNKSLFEHIPNGIEKNQYLNQFHKNIARKKVIQAKLGVDMLVGMVGRFDAQKNFEGFFEVAGMIAREDPSVGFILQGTNIAENKVLVDLARNNGIETKCLLLDFSDDVRDLYQCLDAHLLTSLFGEGFPNVIIESVACGVKNFVFDVGDNDSIAPDEMVTVCDSSFDMAHKVNQFLREGPSNNFCRERFNHFIINNYSITYVFDRYLRSYRRVLNAE